MAATQKAILITEVGKPVVLVTNQPIPEPGPGQVQLKVSVVGLNPHDAKARDTGLFVKDVLPATFGADIVGRVSKLGPGVTGLAIGDRIVAQTNFVPPLDRGGLQEYTVVDECALGKIPDSVSDDAAASLPTNILAPLVALFDTLRIPAPWTPEAAKFDYAGTAVLILGGGSNCGKFGVQLAALAGIGRIVVVGGPEALLKRYGATHVIDRHGGEEAVLERIRAVVGDDLEYVFDAVNPLETQPLGLKALSSHKRGAVARLLPLGPVDTSGVTGKKAGFEMRDTFGSSHFKPELARAFWARVGGWMEEGKIQAPPYVTKQGLTAEVVNEVLDAYRDEKPVTKTHIHF